MTKAIKLNRVCALAALAAITAMVSCRPTARSEAQQPASRDTLDNTVWTSYHSNGVDIIGFEGGRCVNRFYDAITGAEETETNPYRIVDDYIEVTETDSTTYRLYFEITAAGNALSIYKNPADLNNNQPNVVFKKL